MTLNEKISKLLTRNAGHFTTKDARECGIDGRKLQQLVAQEVFERVSYGLYIGAEYFPDSFTIIEHRAPKAVFSHLTALYLHGLSNRDPLVFMLTIESGDYSSLSMADNIRFFYNNGKLINLGVEEVETPSGTKVRAFDVERTLCDCIKYIDKMDSDLILTGFKDYLSSSQRNSSKLIEYATALGIKTQIIRYLEVL